MAVSVLVVTAGAANANSYCALTVANQYHEDRPAADTTWSTATDPQKNAALLWATKLLDRYYVWRGSVVDTSQKLLWPRAGLMQVNEWNALSTTEIPELIQFATAEFARQLLAADRTADNEIATQGISSLGVGSIRLSFRENIKSTPIPDVVTNMIPSEWGYVRGTRQRELQRA